MNGTTTPAPTVRATTGIRNVVLVGPSGAGKSRLFDHVVAACVPERDRVPREEPEPTTGLRAATVATGTAVLTLLDAPGNPDFVGEVRAGLRAADAALFVVSAADGADAWIAQDVIVNSATVGCPPDPFNMMGQDWGTPPLHPHALREQGYAVWQA